MTFNDLPRSARAAWSSARQRARRAGTPILSKEDFVALWSRSAGHCELSGLPFDDTPETYQSETGYRRMASHPWQPSLDQIVPGMGYVPGNCQLVCKCINIGKNSYSEETFLRWVQAVAQQARS